MDIDQADLETFDGIRDVDDADLNSVHSIRAVVNPGLKSVNRREFGEIDGGYLKAEYARLRAVCIHDPRELDADDAGFTLIEVSDACGLEQYSGRLAFIQVEKAGSGNPRHLPMGHIPDQPKV